MSTGNITGPILGGGAALADTVSAINTAKLSRVTITSVSNGNAQFTVPANGYISDVFIRNYKATSVSGGIRIGTASDGAQVVATTSIGASQYGRVKDAEFLQRWFSTSVATTVYISQVVSTVDLNVDLTVVTGVI